MALLVQRLAAGNAPFPLSHPSCEVVGQRVYLFGGHNGNAYTADLNILETTGMGTWDKVPVTGMAPKPRHRGTASTVGQKVFIFGGCVDGKEQVDDLALFNSSLKSWTKPKPKGVSPTPRSGHSAVVHENKIYVFGGETANGASAELFALDTVKSDWQAINAQGTVPSARHSHTASLANKEYAVVFGGTDGSNFFNDIHQYIFASASWAQPATKGTPPSPRANHAAVVVGGKLYVFGGSDATGAVLGDAFTLDLGTWEWNPLPGCPPGRSGAGAVAIGNKIYLCGGKATEALDKSNGLWVISTDKPGAPGGPVVTGGAPATKAPSAYDSLKAASTESPKPVRKASAYAALANIVAEEAARSEPPKAEPAKVEPPKVEPPKPEPPKVEPPKPEPPKVEPPKPEPPKVEPPKPEPPKVEPPKPEPPKVEPPKPEPPKVEPPQPEPPKQEPPAPQPEPPKPEPPKAEPKAEPEPPKPEPPKPEPPTVEPPKVEPPKVEPPKPEPPKPEPPKVEPPKPEPPKVEPPKPEPPKPEPKVEPPKPTPVVVKQEPPKPTPVFASKPTAVFGAASTAKPSGDVEKQLAEAIKRAEKAEAEVESLREQLSRAEATIAELRAGGGAVSSGAPPTPTGGGPPPPPPPPPPAGGPPPPPPPPPAGGPPPPPAMPGKNALFAAIQQGKKLKKAPKPKEPSPLSAGDRSSSSGNLSGSGSVGKSGGAGLGAVMSIAAMAAQKRSQMKQTGNLDKLIANRPDKQDLADKNILPDQDPALKKAQTQTVLEPKLQARPGSADLQKKGILPPQQEGKVNYAAQTGSLRGNLKPSPGPKKQ